MRRLFCKSLIACVILLPSAPAYAEPSSGSSALAAALIAAIRDASSLAASDQKKVVALSNRILVENNLLRNKSFIQKLLTFDMLPSDSGQPSAESLFKILVNAANGIEIGKVSLNGNQKQELADAEKLLYSDTRSHAPSPQLLSYSKYKTKSDSLKEKLTNRSLSSTDRLLIMDEIKSNDTDWRLYGYRVDIEQAMQVMRRYSQGFTTELRDSWINALGAETQFDVRSLDAAFGRSDWSRLTFSTQKYNLSIKVSYEGSSSTASDKAIVSFDYLFVPLRRAVLEHPFLVDTGWRLKGGEQTISDGIEGASDRELIPRIYSNVILIKNLEVNLIDPMDGSFIDGLSKATSADLSGFTFSNSEACYQGKYICLPRAYIIGAVIEELQKIPNPEPGRIWQENR